MRMIPRQGFFYEITSIYLCSLFNAMAFKFLKRGGSEERAEMSFIDHLEALRGHLFRAVISIAIGAIIVGINNKFVIQKILLGPTHADFPTYKFLCKMGNTLHLGNALCMSETGVKMQSTSVAGQFSMWFTVVLIGGIILAFPYIFYEFWRFYKTGTYPKRIIKNKRGYFLGVFAFLYGCPIRFLCYRSLYN